ncbi:helix-turn-helix domain-containing protein [Microbacterium algeriense]|uniref:helix-turn-helix transcriptional regulator n=1 Tax=Microbacterium algeriense TaxID=2615184 RepID=UPI00192CF512|nr:helix-turn-helix transcriptional regulator [Microbacterium barkeri]
MGKEPATWTAEWESFAVALGRNLQRARLAKDMSQEAVAYRVGLTRYTYQAYERGRSQSLSPMNPTLRVVIALSQVLDVPVGDLLPEHAPDVTVR